MPFVPLESFSTSASPTTPSAERTTPFHYARALLLTEGLEPKTHRGVIDLLLEKFEATGRLAAEVTSALARLQTFRGLADYDARQRLTIDRAREEVRSAERFVTASVGWLRSEGWLEA